MTAPTFLPRLGSPHGHEVTACEADLPGLTDLLRFRLSLVLHELTSTHRGHHCPIGEHGYSRTHRPDLGQVELGLLVTPDGLPITHVVFAGNTPDKKTVKEILYNFDVLRHS